MWLALAADAPILRTGNGFASGLALLALVTGLGFRLPALVPAAVVLFGAAYAALVGFESDTLDGRAPVVAAALLLLAELGYWSLELRDAVTDEPGTYLRRIGLLAVSALAALGLGELLLAAVDLGDRGGIAIEALGVVAAVAALAVVALSARPEP